MSSTSSEFGGAPGIIQPDLARVPSESAEVGLYHDSTEEGGTRLSVREAAMAARRAGLKEAAGIPGEVVLNDDGEVDRLVGYTEEQAREDYISGNNF